MENGRGGKLTFVVVGGLVEEKGGDKPCVWPLRHQAGSAECLFVRALLKACAHTSIRRVASH